ncbi:MAG: ClpX C4-type zinc finger protein [Pirellulales bacterium]
MFCTNTVKQIGPLFLAQNGASICGKCAELCSSILEHERQRRAKIPGASIGRG